MRPPDGRCPWIHSRISFAEGNSTNIAPSSSANRAFTCWARSGTARKVAEVPDGHSMDIGGRAAYQFKG